MSDPSTESPPSDVHEAIMEATYRALRSHGYADLTMQDIADEAGKSTSLLHYHYDTKQDLLVTFLEHLVSWFDQRLTEMEAETATERLEALIDVLLPGADDEEWERFHRALLELRTQAPYTEAYREQLRRNKRFLRERFETVIRDGIEAGEFHEVDPERTARFIVSALDGARSSRVTLGDDEDQNAVRAGLEAFVLSDLRRDDEMAVDDAKSVDDDSEAGE